jgi:protein-S-isoprenylcysteine O-methyltransferase Ste14
VGATRRVLQAVLTVAVWISLLFLGARRLDWERGWISVALYLVGMSGTWIVVQRANPEVIVARAKFRRKETKGFDKLFLALFFPLAIIQPFVAGRDAGCASCSSAWPLWTLYPAAVLYLIGNAVIAWTLAVNRHAETSVRIQTDRGHTVIENGPYRYVRHPMYVGVILMYLAFPLIWGSGWAMALSLAGIGLFVWRTGMEDRTLQRELDGYAEFSSRTRYRLIPGLW